MDSFIKKIFFILTFITLTFSYLNSPVLVYSESKNTTAFIGIKAYKVDNKYVINYQILESFNTPSHGIFLDLPLDQDGVEISYKINSVKKTGPIDNTRYQQISQKDNIDTSIINQLQDEKYQQIYESTSLRFRVGG